MRHDRNMKVVRCIPGPRTVTANGATVSAASYGSGGHGTKGIVDTLGWDWVRLEIRKQAGSAQKLSKVKVGFQSGAATLFASCSPLSGRTSGIVLSNVTASAAIWRVEINLAGYASRKRYMNTQATTSTTSGNVDVTAYLFRGEQVPPSTTGFTTSQTFFG